MPGVRRMEDNLVIVLPMGEIPELPDTFVCPICGEKLILDIDEWTSDYDGWKAADSGVHTTCITERDVEGRDEWGSWMDGHFKYPYIDWLPVDSKVCAWLEDNVRFTPRNDSAGEPKKV